MFDCTGRRAVRVGLLLAGLFMPSGGSAAGQTLTAIASFTNETGDQPYASVIFDSVVGRPAALYATTTAGAGDCLPGYGCGSVVRLTPPAALDGAWTLKVLHRFTGADGEVPFAGVILDTVGNLYGTTTRGGGGSCPDGAGCGTIYKLSPPPTDGGSGTTTILYHFTGGSDGAIPAAALVFDNFGALYGTAMMGGTRGGGVAFRLSPPAAPEDSWSETVLHDFSGKDGARPRSNLIFDTTGALYGTSQIGGAFNFGTVFKLAPPATSTGGWPRVFCIAFPAEPMALNHSAA